MSQSQIPLSHHIQCLSAQLSSLSSKVPSADRRELHQYQSEVVSHIHSLQSCLLLAQKIEKDIDEKMRTTETSSTSHSTNKNMSQPDNDVVFIPYVSESKVDSSKVADSSVVVSSDNESNASASTLESLLSNTSRHSNGNQSQSNSPSQNKVSSMSSIGNHSSVSSHSTTGSGTVVINSAQPPSSPSHPTSHHSAGLVIESNRAVLPEANVQPRQASSMYAQTNSITNQQHILSSEVKQQHMDTQESNSSNNNIDLDELLEQPLKPVENVNVRVEQQKEDLSSNNSDKPSEKGLSALDELLTDKQNEPSKELLSFSSPEEQEKEKILSFFSCDSSGSSSHNSNSQQFNL